MNELLLATLHVRNTSKPDELVSQQKAASLLSWLGTWRETAITFEWSAVVNAINRLEVKLKKGASYGDLSYGLRTINDGVHDGLKNQLIFRYPTKHAAVFARWKADWAPVIERFPATAEDARAGTDLWALGHYTASVFHMMRVLENGLSALASEVGVSCTVQNWQNVIEQIEAAIKSAQKSLPRGEARNERLQFLSEAAKEFAYFKDGWRNYVSHNKGSYAEPQARAVLEHVRQFMVTLVINMSASSTPETETTDTAGQDLTIS